MLLKLMFVLIFVGSIPTWGCGEIGIASDLHSEGTGIETRHLHFSFFCFLSLSSAFRSNLKPKLRFQWLERKGY